MFNLSYVFYSSMSEHGVIGVLCSDQQGLALSGQFDPLMLELTFSRLEISNED